MSIVSFLRRATRFGACLGAASVAISCSGSTSSDSIPAEVRPGYELARANGCFACHGEAGVGSIGPAWTDLAGSEVRLADGSTVVADHAYLVRAITEPDAEKDARYSIAMPTVGLDPEQVESIVAYIESLRSDT